MVFIVDEEILTVMDSIVEEHERTGNACKTVAAESSYSGTEPHEWPSSSTEQAYGSPKSQDIKRSMECGVPEKTRNQTKWAVRYGQNGQLVETRNSYLMRHRLAVRLKVECSANQFLVV